MRVALLFGLLILCLAACSSPPPATPAPEPTATAAATVDLIEARQYAAECHTMMTSEFAEGTESMYVQWVQDLDKLDPPPGLEEFNAAMTAFPALQVSDGVVIGPNPKTQAAAEKEIEIVAAMDETLRQVLVEEGCLSEVDVIYGQEFLTARERLLTSAASTEPLTVDEYGQRCSDIQATMPIYGDLTGMFDHLLEHWTAVAAPNELEEYQEAVRMFYVASKREGDAALGSPEADTVAILSRKLDPNVLNRLRAAGCN